jgi:uncharacterized glyoxalase superfamily protein PhnB
MFQIAIPVIQVRDAVAAEEFYCHRLGFALQSAYRPDESKKDPCFLALIRDRARLYVSSFNGGGAGTTAVYIFVEDVDALHTELLAKGIRVNHPPIDQTWGTREISIRDTEHNSITFGQALRAVDTSTPTTA